MHACYSNLVNMPIVIIHIFNAPLCRIAKVTTYVRLGLGTRPDSAHKGGNGVTEEKVGFKYTNPSRKRHTHTTTYYYAYL